MSHVMSTLHQKECAALYLVVVQILATKWALYSQSPSRQSGSITQCARLLQPVSVIYLIYAAMKEAENLSHDCEDKLRLEDVMQHNFSYSTPTTSGRVKDGGVFWWLKVKTEAIKLIQTLSRYKSDRLGLDEKKTFNQEMKLLSCQLQRGNSLMFTNKSVDFSDNETIDNNNNHELSVID